RKKRGRNVGVTVGYGDGYTRWMLGFVAALGVAMTGGKSREKTAIVMACYGGGCEGGCTWWYHGTPGWWVWGLGSSKHDGCMAVGMVVIGLGLAGEYYCLDAG
ncbi:hypothetical protein Pfo_000688, partial [Paulownia fortunei]